MRRLSRRTVLRLLALGVGGGALGYARFVEPRWVQLVRRDLPLPGLPPSLEGCSLVHLSDIHIGHRVSDAFLRRVFSMVDGLEPDIVAYTGDFICNHPGIIPQAERMFPLLPLGIRATFGVLGNHDYGRNWMDPGLAASLNAMLADRGVAMLPNASAEVDGLQFHGVDDLWARRANLRRVMTDHDPGRAAITLCHNPDAVDLPEWNGYNGWVLAGHTHGGQCKPPFLPPPILPVTNTRYTAGEFDIEHGFRMYISRGVGHTFQARFNVRPEITCFTLVGA